MLQAIESFSWNVRVLKGQADLLKQAKHECYEYMKQVSRNTGFCDLTSLFLAATKQLYEQSFLSICHTFFAMFLSLYHREIWIH